MQKLIEYIAQSLVDDPSAVEVREIRFHQVTGVSGIGWKRIAFTGRPIELRIEAIDQQRNVR